MTPMEKAAEIAARSPDLVKRLLALEEEPRQKEIARLIAEALARNNRTRAEELAQIRNHLEIRTRMMA